MAETRKSSVALPMALAGYNSSTAPVASPRENQPTREVLPLGHTLTTHPARPSPLSRNSSYQGSSQPSSRPGTPRAKRPQSQYPDGDFRNSSIADLAELKADVMCNWLYQQQVEKMWSSSGKGEGVMLKKARDDYMCCPRNLRAERGSLFDAVKKLNVKVGFERFLAISG